MGKDTMSYTVADLLNVGPAAAMSYLILAADRRETVGYEDVARYIGQTIDKRFSTSKHHIGNVAGDLIDRILRKVPSAPPINSLIVAQAGNEKGLPSYGADQYVAKYLKVPYGSLSVAQKRQALAPVLDDVWNFKDWRDVARKVFGNNVSIPPMPAREQDGKAKRRGFGGPAESPEHSRLKEYVAAHPVRFGAPNGCSRGEKEKRLETYDEIDVWFMYPGEELAVEVKSVRSDDIDRERGLFQCVKYKALLLARTKLTNTKSLIRSKLVSEVPLTGKLARWARQLGVEVQIIKPLP
jgi:hypothetical protein